MTTWPSDEGSDGLSNPKSSSTIIGARGTPYASARADHRIGGTPGRMVALARSRHELLVRYRPLTPLRSESFRRKGCEARGGVPTSVVGPSRSGTWPLTIEPTVWSSARSSKGRPTEANDRIGRRLGGPDRPRVVEGRRPRSFSHGDESARRMPNPSPRTDPRTFGSWLARGAERKVQGLSPIKSRPLGTRRWPHLRGDQRELGHE